MDKKIVGAVFAVSPRDIKRFSDQPRRTFLGIKELAVSIREYGQQTPIVITPGYGETGKADGGLILIDGERRTLAGLILVKEDPEFKLLAVSRVVRNNRDHYLHSVIANLHRHTTSTMETAQAIARLRDEYDLTWDQIIRTLGMSGMTLKKYYDLTHLHPDIQILMEKDLPREQRLTTAVASEIAQLPINRQLEILELTRGKRTDLAVQMVRKFHQRVKEEGGTVRQPIQGRERHPSDDAHVIIGRLRRINNDLGYILGMEQRELALVLGVLKVESLSQVFGLTSDIGTNVDRLKKRINTSLPKHFSDRLPQAIR